MMRLIEDEQGGSPTNGVEPLPVYSLTFGIEVAAGLIESSSGNRTLPTWHFSSKDRGQPRQVERIGMPQQVLGNRIGGRLAEEAVPNQKPMPVGQVSG